MRSLLTTLFTILFINSFGQVSDSIVTNNGSLYYKSYGKGEKIILISGGPGISSDQLLDMAIRLSDKYNCILYDQRGTGRSIARPFDSTTINLDNSIADLELLRMRLKVNELKIIGHSWGATLALAYAVRNPEKIKSLILIGPGQVNRKINYVMDNRFSRLTKEDLERIKQWNDSIENGRSIERANDEIRKIRLQSNLYDRQKTDSIFQIIKRGTMNASMGSILSKSLNKVDLSNNLKNFKNPILIICGRQDPVGVFPTFEIKELCPHTEIKWIEKSGHFPWLESERDFYLAITEFLAR